MSAELELRWLKIEKTKGTVRRFVEFCKNDVKEQAKEDAFDLEKYQDAVKLIMTKLDKSPLVEKMFSPEQLKAEQQKKAEDAVAEEAVAVKTVEEEAHNNAN